MNWPTLSQGIEIKGFVKRPAFDPKLVTEYENGARGSRARSTVVPNEWEGYIEGMTLSDANKLESFRDHSVYYGTESFIWWDTLHDESYAVFMDGKPFEIKPYVVQGDIPVVRYRTSNIRFVEAHPTS